MLFKDITLVDENFKVREHVNLLTKGSYISYIGEETPEEEEVFNGHNKVLLPAFFNTHCHVPMTLLRGYGEGLPLQRWLTEKMFPFEAKLTEEDCYWGAMLGLIEMIKSGVASFSDMYFNIFDIARAVEDSGLKVNICHGLSAGEHYSDLGALKGIKDSEALIKQIAKNKNDRIKVDLGLHAEYTSIPALVKDLAIYAKSQNLTVHTHLSETKSEHESCIQKYKMTPLQYFKSCGLLEQPLAVAHCVWATEEDIALMAEHKVYPLHCVSSNLKLGSGFAPVRDMLKRNLPVSIGTDGASSNNNLNMLEEMALVAMVNKGVTRDAEFIQPVDVLKMATYNGAITQGRSDCGIIKVGNKADLVVFDMDKPHLQPVFDVLSNIIFSAQADDICLSMVDGKVVYRDGKIPHMDVEKIIYQCRSIKDRILGELR